MIECPWCSKEVEIRNGRCPQCQRRLDTVTEADFEVNEPAFSFDTTSFASHPDDAHNMIIERFRCAKCGHAECVAKEVAMTGTGLSKLFDIQHHHYLFVSCANCGYVEIYNPNILNGKKSGQLGTIMDILFGG